MRRQRLPLHPGCRRLRHLLLLRRRRELGPAHLPGLERSDRNPGRGPDRHPAELLRGRPGLRRRSRDGLRAAARLERQLQLGEWLAGLLLEPDLQFRHRAQGPDLQGLRGDRGLPRRRPGRRSGRRCRCVEQSGDRHRAAARAPTTFSDKSTMWADNAASSPRFGTAYVCYTQFKSQQDTGPEKIAVSHSTDGGDTWSRPTTLSSAFDNPTAPGPPGLLDPDRQQGHRLRGLGGLTRSGSYSCWPGPPTAGSTSTSRAPSRTSPT